MGQPYTMGDKGGRIVNSADGEVTGTWRVLQVLEVITITTLTVNGITAADTAKVGTLAPGVYLFGMGITVFEISAGLAYLVD